jgi:1-aminocyclopropane-1-carboxylate deaminase/D-cysteine desulfhydrase-like pyridoxal-dependent ACC family enzyme
MVQRSQIWENTPVQEINHPKINGLGIRLLIKRDDLVHPDISGNKWRKLKYNIQKAQELGCNRIITFGGAFSNHIAATAVAAAHFGLESLGIIRGEDSSKENTTLSFARQHSMQLEFVSREIYRQKDDPDFLSQLQEKWPNGYIIPEGGANELGIIGCTEILSSLEELPDYVVVAIGTGTTYRGLLRVNANKKARIIGIPVLKGFETFEQELQKESENGNGHLIHDYHFGGYAKYKPKLVEFINEFKAETSIALDPVYTGKMMFGIFDLASKGYFAKGSSVMAIHTGGLQGIAGFNGRYGRLIV